HTIACRRPRVNALSSRHAPRAVRHESSRHAPRAVRVRPRHAERACYLRHAACCYFLLSQGNRVRDDGICAGVTARSTHLRRTAMPFSLPPLPYPADALEAAIDKQTMEIHHGRHHKAYVDNLNTALQGHDALASKPIELLLREINSVPQDIRQKVI